MKLDSLHNFRRGLVVQDQIFDSTHQLCCISRRGPEDLMSLLIEQFPAYRGRIEAAVTRTRGVDFGQVKLRAPLPRPANIVCMAVNYDDGLISAPHTNAFHKATAAMIGPSDMKVSH